MIVGNLVKLSFRLTSALCSKFYFRNIEYLPVVLFLHALISNENPDFSSLPVDEHSAVHGWDIDS